MKWRCLPAPRAASDAKGRRRVAHQLHRKGIVPRAEKETAREVLESLEKGDLREKPWEVAMRRRNELERQAYRAEAERLRAAARQNDNDREALLKAAADLERYSPPCPPPRLSGRRCWTSFNIRLALRIRGPPAIMTADLSVKTFSRL